MLESETVPQDSHVKSDVTFPKHHPNLFFFSNKEITNFTTMACSRNGSRYFDRGNIFYAFRWGNLSFFSQLHRKFHIFCYFYEK